MNKIELLAPAGSIESLYAAINNGADAVYLGGNKFSARANASNFDNETMKKAVDYCHSYNVKIYVTVNTVLKQSELQDAIKYVGYLYEIGVDALIIQDLGLVRLIEEKYADFEIHASTQLTIHNGEGAIYYKDKGFKRIVLSRELSLKEIRYISEELDIETEIFVHGAMCVCYSGKCLLSSMIGGRSGNRGRCAQPCRMEYTLKSNTLGEKRGYLLSPKDMCTVDYMKDIIESKTRSLKIEGRMKKPEYVAGVVDTYRNAIDKEIKGTKFDLLKGRRKLLQLFNREGLSSGYLIRNVGKDMMSYSFPKNTGVLLGMAEEDLSVTLREDISLGDGIRYNSKGFTLSKILIEGKEVQNAKRGDKVKLFPKDYKKNDSLYITSSKQLNSSLEESIKPYNTKISINAEVDFEIDKPLIIKTKIFGKEFKVLGDIVEMAQNKPLSKERIEDALKKSGEHPYKIQSIIFSEYQEGFVKISSLNNLRRELFEKIIKEKASEYRRERTNLSNEIVTNYKNKLEIGYLFTCTTKEQLKTLVEYGVKYIGVNLFLRGNDSLRKEDIKVYENINFYLMTPDIIKTEFQSVVNLIEDLKDNIKGLITSNAGIINLYKDKMTLIGDYKLNIFNSKALDFYMEDLNMLTLSAELNRSEIKELMKGTDHSVAQIIYGKAELMVSEYCPIGSTFGGKSKENECNKACNKDEFTLVDRMNENFKVMTDVYCRSHIMNSVPLNLINEIDKLKGFNINSYRIDFTDESASEVNRVLFSLDNKTIIEENMYTNGHFRRGVE